MLRAIFVPQTNLPLCSLPLKPKWLTFIHREASSKTRIHSLTDYWALMLPFHSNKKDTGIWFQKYSSHNQVSVLETEFSSQRRCANGQQQKPKHSLGTKIPRPPFHVCLRIVIWGQTFLCIKWGLFQWPLSSVKLYSRGKYVKCIFKYPYIFEKDIFLWFWGGTGIIPDGQRRSCTGITRTPQRKKGRRPRRSLH